ncbi:MAG: amidohydrolase family protein [Deferrisomatales bacterium]|nr:amidohydrolase family protein [Deferrisomatales bacterium]
MVIDSHTHVFERHNAPRIMLDMAQRARIPSFADGTLDGLLQSMDASGVDLSVISRITTRPEQVGPVNDWLASLQGPRIRSLATMHPGLPSLCDEVGRLAERGFPGFKLHPDYQGFFVDEERMFPFYEAARDAGMWLLFHAGLDRGLPGREVHAPPERLLRVHEAVPGLRIVAAHMGGEDLYEETERCLLGRDIYLDTSFVLRKMSVAVLKRMLRKHPAERILFGSDSPWSHPGQDLAFLSSLDFLPDRARERITGGNAAELLGMVPPSRSERSALEGGAAP